MPGVAFLVVYVSPIYIVLEVNRIEKCQGSLSNKRFPFSSSSSSGGGGGGGGRGHSHSRSSSVVVIVVVVV